MEYLFIGLVLILVYPSFQANVEAKRAGGFTIDLIHHDSKLSPFYNESATLHDLATRDALCSIARSNHFSSQNPLVDAKTTIQSPVTPNTPNGGGYIMKLSFGTPPVETYAIADTGSDLVWIQCDCDQDCYPQSSPTFMSASSSTYQELACGTNYCKTLDQSACGGNSECLYLYEYGDGSQTRGVLASDIITFDSTDGQTVPFSGSVFGCGNDNTGSFNSVEGGLVGLGGGFLSLISQLGDRIEKKFSYCLLPRTANSASKLKFGSDSVLSGPGVVSTPFFPTNSGTFYILNLEGISVGNNRIPNTLAGASNGNIVIDSGSTLTALESGFYQEVEDAVRAEIPLNPLIVNIGTRRLCYDRSSFGGVSGFSMVFHFAGADVTLQQLNLFKVVSDSLVCLAIRSAGGGLPIFGNVAQVNFQVEYDLGRNQISFAPADCTQA